MKNLPILLLPVCLFLFSACKKSSTSQFSANNATPSIVGTWAMTNFSGIVANYKDSMNVYKEFDSYSNATKTFTTAYSTGGLYFDSLFYQLTTETWTFKTDGTYVLNEFYTTGPNWAGPLDTFANVCTGAWAYQNNAQTNIGLILEDNPTILVDNLIANVTESNTFSIHSVSNTSLIITYLNTAISGISYNLGYTITFAKQ